MTDRIDVNQKLAALELAVQRLELALQAAELGLWEWDLTNDRASWSRRMEAIHGGTLAPDQKATTAYQRYVHPDDREAVAEAVRAAREDGIAIDIRYRIRRGEEIRWIEARGAYLPATDATQPIRMVGTCQDVTNEHTLRTALQHERSQLRQIFEQAPAAITITQGAQHKITFLNLQARRLVGNRRVIGRTIREAFPELEGQGYFELLDQVYRTGVPFTGDRMPARWDKYGTGEMVEAYFNIVYQPLRDHTGQVWGIMSHSVDLTNSLQSDPPA